MEHHFEIHVALGPHDVEAYVASGLPDPGPDMIPCSNCGTDIGASHERFIPLAIVLNSTSDHFLCLSCSAPVTKPKN